MATATFIPISFTSIYECRSSQPCLSHANPRIWVNITNNYSLKHWRILKDIFLPCLILFSFLLFLFCFIFNICIYFFHFYCRYFHFSDYLLHFVLVKVFESEILIISRNVANNGEFCSKLNRTMSRTRRGAKKKCLCGYKIFNEALNSIRHKVDTGRML